MKKIKIEGLPRKNKYLPIIIFLVCLISWCVFMVCMYSYKRNVFSMLYWILLTLVNTISLQMFFRSNRSHNKKVDLIRQQLQEMPVEEMVEHMLEHILEDIKSRKSKEDDLEE